MKLYETEFYTFNVSQKIKKHFNISSVMQYNKFFPLENSVSYKLSDKKEYSPNIPKGFTEDGPELQQQKSFDFFVYFVCFVVNLFSAFAFSF